MSVKISGVIFIAVLLSIFVYVSYSTGEVDSAEEANTTSASGYEEESVSDNVAEAVVGPVNLQNVSPGAQQVGNMNIDGTGLFGRVGASGDSGVDNLTGIDIEHTGTNPRKWSVGAVGSQRKGSFAIRDETRGKELITINNWGKVGIFKKWPKERLDVAGNVKANRFIGDGSLLTNIPSGSLGTDIDSSEIVDGTIQNVDIGNGAINSAKIANGTVANADLANNAVNSAKIANGTVANADLANNAVNSAKIANGTVANADLANNAVNSAKITDGAIVNADISSGANIAASKLQYGNLFINSGGTAGQVWKSDGSGRGVWGTDLTGGGGSLWSKGSGSDIYYNSGNVGIWMVSPAYELDVSGTIRSSRTSLGVGVIGDVTDGTGVAGQATGSTGTGVYGEASNTGAVTNYGGYFRAMGSAGMGVYGRALYTGSIQDKNTNYGGYFQSDGFRGIGVYGRATSSTNNPGFRKYSEDFLK